MSGPRLKLSLFLSQKTERIPEPRIMWKGCVPIYVKEKAFPGQIKNSVCFLTVRFVYLL